MNVVDRRRRTKLTRREESRWASRTADISNGKIFNKTPSDVDKDRRELWISSV